MHPSPTIQKKVRLDRTDVEWYESTYPGNTLSWTLGMLLAEYRKAHGDKSPCYFGILATSELIKGEVDV